MRVIGVDGARGGWLAAALDGAVDVDGVTWRWTVEFADLLADPAAVVAADIPIGLPDSGARDCDRAGRQRLGPRRSSVFAAPLRCVLTATSYADARALLAARGAPSMSAQAFGIVRAVAQVDATMTPALEDRVIEAHPELAFASLAGVLPPKRTPEGAAAREAALQAAYGASIDVAAAVARAPRPAAADDALDALACAWTARCHAAGQTVTLGDGTRDARGLLMRIVMPRAEGS